MLTHTTTKAAALIGTSQSAISRLLGELEQLTHLTLFDRQRGRLFPTAQAQMLFEEVQRRYAGLDYLRDFALQLSNSQAPSIKVGAMLAYSMGLLGRITVKFKERHPQTRVQVSVGSSELIRDQVASRAVEVGLIARGWDISALDNRASLVQEAICAIPADHPLAAKRIVSFDDLACHPFISYLDSDMMRWGLTQRMAQDNRCMDVVASVRYAATVCGMVSAGVGVGLVQLINAYDYLHSPRIVFRKLKEELLFHTYIVTPMSPAPTPAVQTWAELAESTFTDICHEVRAVCAL